MMLSCSLTENRSQSTRNFSRVKQSNSVEYKVILGPIVNTYLSAHTQIVKKTGKPTKIYHHWFSLKGKLRWRISRWFTRKTVKMLKITRYMVRCICTSNCIHVHDVRYILVKGVHEPILWTIVRSWSLILRMVTYKMGNFP